MITMRKSILAILILFGSHYLFAQRDNVSLLAQSPDGKLVKLVWFFKSWNSDITGFDIKRKEGLQDWVKLNTAPILPEVSAKKKLNVVEPDKNEVSRVRAKMYKMLSAKKLTAIDHNEFLEQLNKDYKMVEVLSEKLSRDYDLALIYGFGFVDRSIKRKTNYEYGVFIQGTDILLDSVLWNYGEIPDLDAVTKITSKSLPGVKGIQVSWTADVSKMRGNFIAGFNIYRQGIRLNSLPVVAKGKNAAEFTWNDKTANSEAPSQYSISAQSIFGIEGIIKSYTYNPAEHPEEYEKAEVTEVTALGFYFKDGIRVKWNFPQGYFHFIKGFYIEKANLPEGYKTISPMLDTTSLTFIDKTPSPVEGYVSFRVNAIYNDETVATGSERLYNYFPVRQPPPPMDFKASYATGAKKLSIYFSWGRIQGDSVTDYYKIYDFDTVSNEFYPITDQPIKDNRYYYPIERQTSAIHRFYVTSVGRNGSESATSDTVVVFAPSFVLPVPEVTYCYIDNDNGHNNIVIKWTYPNITDLKGFRVYQNKSIIANENTLGRSKHELVIPVPEDGGNFEFTIKAVSESGVISQTSNAMSVSVPVPKQQ